MEEYKKKWYLFMQRNPNYLKNFVQNNPNYIFRFYNANGVIHGLGIKQRTNMIQNMQNLRSYGHFGSFDNPNTYNMNLQNEYDNRILYNKDYSIHNMQVVLNKDKNFDFNSQNNDNDDATESIINKVLQDIDIEYLNLNKSLNSLHLMYATNNIYRYKPSYRKNYGLYVISDGLNSKVCVYGGIEDSSNNILSDFWIYTFRHQWLEVDISGGGIAPRCNFGFVAFEQPDFYNPGDSSIIICFVIGGTSRDGSIQFKDMYALVPEYSGENTTGYYEYEKYNYPDSNVNSNLQNRVAFDYASGDIILYNNDIMYSEIVSNNTWKYSTINNVWSLIDDGFGRVHNAPLLIYDVHLSYIGDENIGTILLTGVSKDPTIPFDNDDYNHLEQQFWLLYKDTDIYYWKQIDFSILPTLHIFAWYYNNVVNSLYYIAMPNQTYIQQRYVGKKNIWQLKIDIVQSAQISKYREISSSQNIMEEQPLYEEEITVLSLPSKSNKYGNNNPEL